MKLLIHDNLSVEEIQDRFSECFPGLKLEFYTKPHHWKKGFEEGCKIDPKTKLLHVRKNHDAGILNIKSTDTVGKVESGFREKFGLNVQVWRNENNAWIQTTSTDTYTLKDQMEFAQRATKTIFPTVDEQLNEYDYL